MEVSCPLTAPRFSVLCGRLSAEANEANIAVSTESLGRIREMARLLCDGAVNTPANPIAALF